MQPILFKRFYTTCLAALLGFLTGCSNDKTEIKRVITTFAETVSFSSEVAPFEKLDLSARARNLFSRNVTFLGRGANETEARRCGDRIVKDGTLALLTHFASVRVEIGSGSVAVNGPTATFESSVTVTARDKDRNDQFRESNRIKLQLRKEDGSWRIFSAENIDPLSFEFSAEEGSDIQDTCQK